MKTFEKMRKLALLVALSLLQIAIFSEDCMADWSSYFRPNRTPRYILVTGEHEFSSGNWTVLEFSGIGANSGGAVVTQNGGTFNPAALILGRDLSPLSGKRGVYILNQGLLNATSARIEVGDFIQNGGQFLNSGGLNVQRDSTFRINDGAMTAAELTVGGRFDQYGGMTTFQDGGSITGLLRRQNVWSRLGLHGGTMSFGGELKVLRHPFRPYRRGEMTMTGGFLNANVYNQGEWNLFGGTHWGDFHNVRLHQEYPNGSGTFWDRVGEYHVRDATTYRGSFLNDGIYVIHERGKLTLQGVGITNGIEGELRLDGGTVLGSGSIVNHGNFWASGEILGTGGLTNYGQLEMVNKALNLERGGGVINHGQWNVVNTSLNLSDSTRMFNQGELALHSSEVSGFKLENQVDGVIWSLGNSRIDISEFSNVGQVLIGSGQLEITSAWENDGEIVLANDTARLTGSALDNYGTISGRGHIDAAITNRGQIRAEGGRLEIHQPIAARRDSILSASEGGTLWISSSEFENRERVILEGGKVQFAGQLENRGIIFGQGSLASSGLTNRSEIRFHSDISSVEGSVDNRLGGLIELQSQAVVDFQHDVTLRHASTMLLAEGSLARYWGDVYVESGVDFIGSGHHRFERSLQSLGGPQTLSFAGDVSFGYDHVYLAQIGPELLDQLYVEGNLNFDGMLVLSTLPGFIGEIGDSFQLFDWGTTSGGFRQIDLTNAFLQEGQRWDLSQLHTSGTLHITAVPEPSNVILIQLALAAMILRRQRRSSFRTLRNGQVQFCS